MDKIQAHAQSLTSRLKEGLKSQGFALLTPDSTRTPIVTAVCENAYSKLRPKMQERGIVTTVSRHRFRPTVSVFNTLDDIEAFLAAVGTA